MFKLWEKHCDFIAATCIVKRRTSRAIWYLEYEDGYWCGFCELRNGEMYTCNTLEEFKLITEMA